MKRFSGALCMMLLAPLAVFAEEPVFHIAIANHLFVPDSMAVPAGVRFKLIIENRDATPEEFESFELNREKVVMGNTTATVYVGPLKPGTYPFFGEFNPETAQGQLIATPIHTGVP